MGQTISSLWTSLFSKENLRILMIGLDGAGKTTILYKLGSGDNVTTEPTIGYNVELVEFRNLRFTVYDCGGETTMRSIWQCFVYNSAGVIYVVDSTDRERIDEAEVELSTILQNEYLKDSVILVLANKQDLTDAFTASELAEKMRMQERKHQWYVQGTCARSGSGLLEGLENLHRMLSEKRRK